MLAELLRLVHRFHLKSLILNLASWHIVATYSFCNGVRSQMAHQVAEIIPDSNAAWSTWSIWNATNQNVKNGLPDPPPNNKYFCRKCQRVFTQQREAA